jgi:BirA family biotin operon repressor/biotin-[acetyl-CoA-carboxylase] ligase
MRWDIHRFATVSSTMDVCRDLAGHGEPEGIVVVADAQTAGRGRVGRAWYSPPGQAIYASVLLRPALLPMQIGWLTMIGALAVIDCASGLSLRHAALGIKWPNDVMVGGRKLAGVLVETSWTSDQLDYAVLGVGVNVNTRFDDAPDEVRVRATSLREASGQELDREAVLDGALASLARRYMALPASPLADYVRRIETLGRRVHLDLGGEVVEGEAVRVGDDGALVVAAEAGERTVRFGDIHPHS